MTHPTAQFPNETYLEGLRQADAGIIESIYHEFRKPVIRAVESAGGSSADGATFFRVATIHASMLARDQQPNEAAPPVFYLLKNLALAHFCDWAGEKGLELPEQPAASDDELSYAVELPNGAARQEFRQYIRARRQFLRLDNDCQKRVQELAKDAAIGLSDPRLESDATEVCLEKYRQNLGDNEPEWTGTLPAAVIFALSDPHFQKVWSAAETMEGRLSMGQSVSPPRKDNTTRNVLVLLGLLFLGYGVWSFFGPSKTPKAVYEENFKPPASIMADRAARMAKDTVPVELNEACEQLFQEADELYKRKDYTEAAGVLYTMVGAETEVCKSDALFYLGIMGLLVEEPEITLECLAKIPDLDRFGEDLYWYQALAFVKIAAQNPARKEMARRAVERARSNTELPERKVQAEKMLEQLMK